MVSTELKTSMVIAGRGARVCDMCGKGRSKWYCAADEAYLCERCDECVHSANAVAKRHDRVRLGPNGAPVKLKPSHHHIQRIKSKDSTLITRNDFRSQPRELDVQKWCSISQKRSQTTRTGANKSGNSVCNSIVPSKPEPNTFLINDQKDEISLVLYDLLCKDDNLASQHSEVPPCEVKLQSVSPYSTLTRDCPETKLKETEFTPEVPTYEPLLQYLIDSNQGDLMEKPLPSSPSVGNVSCGSRASLSVSNEKKTPADGCEVSKHEKSWVEVDGKIHSHGLLDCGAGDVNDGTPIDENSDIDTFDVMDLCSNANLGESVRVEELNEEFPTDVWKSTYRCHQESYASIFEGDPFQGKGERDLDLSCMDARGDSKPLQQCPQQSSLHRPLVLHLDFEEVINAWSDRGSFWLDGQRPQTVPDINLASYTIGEHGMKMMVESNCDNRIRSQAGKVPSFLVIDKGRSARVLRYKEKRRTRLFSKRIRYEVRKLNAE